MRACRWVLTFALLLSLSAPSLLAAAGTLTVGGLAANRGHRAFSGAEYEQLRARLGDPARFGSAGTVTRAVEFAPDLDVLGESSLSSLNVLVLSEVSNSFAKSDAEQVAQFVRQGGSLLLITDTLHRSLPLGGNGAPAVSAILQELDGGSAAPSGDLFGIQSNQSALIVGSDSAVLNGPFGQLSAGDRLSATFHVPLTPGSLSRVLATRRGSPVLMEIPPGALGPASGGVLVAGDSLFSDAFLPPAEIGLLENENNAIVIENFVAQAAAVPEPATVVLASAGALLVGWASARRGRRQAG